MVGKFDSWASTRGKAADRVLPWWLTLSLLGSALAIGSAPYWVSVGTLGAIILTSPVVFGRLARGWSRLSMLLLLLAVYSAVQLAPLPVSWLEVIAPHSAEYFRGLERIPGTPVGRPWGSLSLDPGATALEVLKWSVYALVSAASGRVVRVYGFTTILVIVGGVGSCLSLIALGHVLVSAERVFGLYAPIPRRAVLGPLINPNHLASYANLAALSCVGLALTGSGRVIRLLSLGASALNVIACFVSASRGGVLALLVGLGLLAAMALWIQPPRTRLSRGWTLSGYAALVALGVASLSTARSRELFDSDLSKFALLPRALEAAEQHLLWGVGRGAFDSLSLRYYPELGSVVFRSIEAFPVSFLVEWGAPVTLVALTSLGMLLVPARLGALRDLRRAAAWIALFSVFLQNLADIGLELPSLSLAVWALFGALESSADARRSEQQALSRPRSGGAAVAVLLAAIGALASTQLGPNAFERRRDLHARFVARDPHFEAVALKAMLACPADPYFPFLAGVAKAREGQDALRLGAIALHRAPSYGRAHFLVGRALLGHGARSQAILEFRLAMQSDPSLIEDAVRAGLSAAPDEEMIERLIPIGAHRDRVLFELYLRLPDAPYAELRRRLLVEAVSLAPGKPGPLSMLLFEWASDLRKKTVPCATGRCPLDAEGELREELSRGRERLKGISPTSCVPVRVEALLLELDGRGRDAEARLAESCSACKEAVSCTRDRLELADRIGDTELMGQAENSYRALSCSSPESCARAEEYLGARARSRGETAKAANHLFSAASQAPTGARYLAAARAYVQARALTRAASAYERAKQLGATDPTIEQELSSLRRDSLRELLKNDKPSPGSGAP